MCHGSSVVPVNRQVQLEVGKQYRVLNVADAPSRPGRTPVLAALVQTGMKIRSDGSPELVACCKSRTPLTIAGVPRLLQMNYDLPPTMLGDFHPGDPGEEQDYIVTLNGKVKIPLSEFLTADNSVSITVRQHASSERRETRNLERV